MKRRGGASPKAVRKLKTNDQALLCPLHSPTPPTHYMWKHVRMEVCVNNTRTIGNPGHFWAVKLTALGCIVQLLSSQELRDKLAAVQEIVRASETGGQVHWDVTNTDTQIIRRSCEHIYTLWTVMYSGLKVKLSLLRVCVWERESKRKSLWVCMCVYVWDHVRMTVPGLTLVCVSVVHCLACLSVIKSFNGSSQ